MMRDMPVYLDNNATTPLVKAAMTEMLGAMARQQTPHQFMALGVTRVYLLSLRVSRWRLWRMSSNKCCL